MTPGARLAAAAAILDALDLARPVEPQLKTWARENRYAGSGDRRAIADRVYTCLRRKGSCAAQGAGETGRALVLGSLVLEDRLSLDRIAAFCSGGYALTALTLEERSVLGVQIDDDPRLDWPEWLLPEAGRAFGNGLNAELDVLRRRAPLDLRVNTLKITRSEAREALAREGIETEDVTLAATALRAEAGAPIARSRSFAEGWVEPQDAASQCVAEFAQVEPGQTVLDFCAGAGGKTLALAALMNNRGRLLVHDVSEQRMAPLAERAQRAGVTIIAPLSDGDKSQCDCVFVDAPCSGSGSWRRDPAAKWRLDVAGLETLHGAQRDVLAQAARFVRPGGRLVYATCSVLPSENEDRAIRFADEMPLFAPDTALHLHPARDGADGFFAAGFRRAQG